MKNTNLYALSSSSLLLIALGMGTGAKAATIDFEDPGVAQPVGTLKPNAGPTVTSQGFIFTSSLPTSGFNDEFQLARNSPFTGDGANGTTNLGIQDTFPSNTANNIVTLAEATGKKFSLQSLDIAEFNTSLDYARTVKVIGNVSGGGTLTKTITLDGIVDGPNPPGTLVDFQTVTFTSWTNLLNVTFQGSGSPGDPVFFDTSGLDAFLLDNLAVTTESSPPPPTPAKTPEPSMVLGTVIGFGLAGLLGRRRSHG